MEDPRSDLVLVKLVDTDGIKEWLLDSINGHGISRWEERFSAAAPRHMEDINEDSMPGDEVWLCRSEVIGPLTGNEGLALVRGGKIVKYHRVIDY